jgi:hypothetical protein
LYKPVDLIAGMIGGLLAELIFEQVWKLRPPKARTWSGRGHTPTVTVTGRGLRTGQPGRPGLTQAQAANPPDLPTGMRLAAVQCG